MDIKRVERGGGRGGRKRREKDLVFSIVRESLEGMGEAEQSTSRRRSIT